MSADLQSGRRTVVFEAADGHASGAGLVPVASRVVGPPMATESDAGPTQATAEAPTPAPAEATPDDGSAFAVDEPPPVALTLPPPEVLPIPLLVPDPDSLPEFASASGDPDAAGLLESEPLPHAASRYTNLWDRLRAGFRMSASTEDPLVRQHMRAFASAPEDLARIVERSRRYLFFILGEVEKRRMPSELALLPMIESAFDPRAYSRGQASGIWQFIPSTGNHYGLRQNWWYDGRRDVLSSTYSALNYLARLHTRFGSWELALAAYNCGESRLARAIEQNAAQKLKTDFWSLSLPAETRNYVPKLLAIRALMREPERHRLWLAPIANQPYFATVKTNRNVDLKQAAAFAGVSEAEFLALNPAFNRPVIGGMGQRTILVPVQSADVFAARLRDPGATLVSWRMHVLKRGEVIDRVAGHFGISGAELKRVNGIDASKTLAGGGAILVPVGAGSGVEPRFDSSLRPEAEVPEPPRSVSHRVAPGESLGSIAARYRTTAHSLRVANRIGARSRIVAGQTLLVPGAMPAVATDTPSPHSVLPTAPAASAAAPAPRVRDRRYTVRNGDTLFGISRKLGVPLADLQKCNRMSQHSRLATGQVLTLPIQGPAR